MRTSQSAAFWAAAAALFAAAPPAFSGSFEVAPTTVVLRPETGSGVLYVNNYGDTAVAVQVQPQDWTQTGGEDVLKPSVSLMVSPPIVSIPAQGRQTVRLMLKRQPGTGERSFRLLVSQLPDSLHVDEHSIRVLMQFSVPVFASATPASARNIFWSASLHDAGLTLSAQNRSSQHAKLTGLEFEGGAGERIPLNRLAYVLGGSSRIWHVACARCVAGEIFHVKGTDEVSGTGFDEALVAGR